MKRGYTLIELLVTLAILGIFGAILYPVFTRRREWRRDPRGICSSNLKQIGLGMLQYEQDYDERLPPVPPLAGPPVRAHPLGWAMLLQPYIKSTQIFQCPLDQDTRRSQFTDYWFNGRLYGRSLSWLAQPAAVFLCGDGNDGHDRVDSRYAIGAWPEPWSHEPSPVLRHDGRGSFLWADGSVKSLSLPQILDTRGFEPRFEKPRPPRK